MPALPHYRRLLLLTEGRLGVFTSKTAAVLLRYRAPDIVALVDAAAAGRRVADVIPWAPDVPILPTVEAAQPLHPDALFIGIAPVGGALPLEMRAHVSAALALGIDVVSGLHTFLQDDGELARIAVQNGARIHDLRRPPGERCVACGRARSTRARRVLTVGTDCNVGKMVAALELTAAAQRRGLRARFVATGQTGIMVAGDGVAIDACVSDFAAGAVEQLVLANGDADVCFVEGQGSLGHPGFSPVTLALLHGACPDALVLVHEVGRTRYKAPPHDPLPPLPRLIAAYEETAALLHPARVVGVAINAAGQDPTAAARARREIEQELDLPVADVLRDGADTLLGAALGT